MRLFILTTFLAITSLTNAQTKKVLLEEFTGAYCGNCPMGSYVADSLLTYYPDLVSVSLHTYSFPDSMFFAQIDTLGIEYAPGAPLGGVDRIYSASWGYVAEIYANWGTNIQNRLALPAELTVSLNATWNSSTRNISTNISADILSNMITGDYRFNLYVVEDSVIGSGLGYDQSNIYNTLPGNQFFGLGDPIVGFVHRHVVRAILPQAWGQPGIISSTPTLGQNFGTTINYTLPPNYDETKIKLVAFVSKFSAGHQGDEVLNVEEINLNTAVGIEKHKMDVCTIYPSPASTYLFIESTKDIKQISIIDLTGKTIKIITTHNTSIINIEELAAGIYFLKVETDNEIITKKVIKR